VISDTHGVLRPEATAALAGSDVIVHAGDIGSTAVLDALRAIAPVVAVRGNNDRDAWAASLPEEVITDVGGLRVCVVHDVKALAIDAEDEAIDVVIAGHSHRPSIERRGRLLLVNPGSAGPRRFSLPVTVARLTSSTPGANAEIVALEVPAPRRPTSAGDVSRRRVRRRAGLRAGS
jgi:putative phosphoesterase